MARPRARQKQKSSRPILSRKPSKRKRKISICGDEIIKANWDKKQTLSQNYKRLGLIANPNRTTGGREMRYPPKEPTAEELESVAKRLGTDEAIIQRDDQGSIINIIYGKGLASDEEIEPENAKTDVVRDLEKQASIEYCKPRTTSVNEAKWLEQLVARYGDNICEMARDRRLNPYQNTPGEIARKLARWKSSK